MECFTPETPARYYDNYDRLTGNDVPCFICAKPVKVNKYWARTCFGTEICTDAYADANPSGDTGNYPIGPECYRKLPAEAKKLVKKVL